MNSGGEGVIKRTKANGSKANGGSESAKNRQKNKMGGIEIIMRVSDKANNKHQHQRVASK